ncbi:MAG: hypothetical protein ACRCT1_03430 [Microcoleaceae cyanobacterium]
MTKLSFCILHLCENRDNDAVRRQGETGWEVDGLWEHPSPKTCICCGSL